MTDRKDPFEERLREALRADTERVDPSGAADDSSELLERVHRGAARRRARRRVGGLVATAVLTSAILVTLPLVTPPPSGEDTANGPSTGSGPDRTGPGSGHAARDQERLGPRQTMTTDSRGGGASGEALRGTPVDVADVKVTSVSASSDDELWLSGYGNCGNDQLCNVLGHSGNGGADVEFTTLPGSVHSHQTTIRFTRDGETGWVTDGGDIFRTDSGGKTWTRLRQPNDVRVSDLEAWEDEVWAVGSRITSQETVVLASDRHSDRLVNVRESPELTPADAVAFGSRSFGVRRVDPELNLSHTSDGGKRWADAAIGCEPADVSATDGAAWALCEDVGAVARSDDEGRSWQPLEPLDAAVFEPPTKIAAIDADTAFVAGSGQGWVVESQVHATEAVGIGEGTYTYVAFSTEEVGYLVGYDGRLCRTDDGGYSWEPVELP